MLTIISPAKTLDYETPLLTEQHTMPQFLNDSQQLAQICKTLSADDVAKLMSISPKLAKLNYERFQNWQPSFNLTSARQAILAFKGDVYEGLQVADFSNDDLQFAQSHLRILSGLYGLLRPLDLILPYRLEMGIRLKNGDNSNLYQFWADRLTEHLNQLFTEKDNAILINLASNEYFKAISPKRLKAKVIHPIFLDQSKDQYKIISFYAKRARGLMSRFIIKHKISRATDLKQFDVDGYQFDSARSTESEWTFIRHH